MNCPNCNAALVSQARFCPVCGTAIPDASSILPVSPASISEAPTLLEALPPQGQWTPPAALQQSAPPPVRPQPLPPFTQQPPAQIAPQRPFSQAGIMLSRPATRTRSRGKGCLLRSLIALGLLLILFTAAWFFALRPALRSLAENQIGEVLTSGMAEINPVTTALVPAGIPLPVPESLISDALVMPSSSWFTIQNMQLNITPEAINVSFSVQVALFTFTCTVTTVPQIVNGQPVVSTLTTTGPVSLVISSGEIKAEVNSYLSQIRGRIQRPIAALTLENHFLLVTLGPVTGS